MMPKITLSMTADTYRNLQYHLFPGDNCEAAAILICTKTPSPRIRLLAKEVILIPHSECKIRTPYSISWPGSYIERAIDIAEKHNMSLILIHSHPGGLLEFSELDNASDKEVINCIFNALNGIHGSAIMTPDGAIKSRIYKDITNYESIDLISIIGDDIDFFWNSISPQRPIAFTSSMSSELNKLSASVIGASGTGSIVIEQLSRLGLGKIYMIDFDKIETKNLNRILNSGREDALHSRYKVDILHDAISRHRPPETSVPIRESISTRSAVLHASQSDFIFCCADSLEPRFYADKISSTFLIPLIDVGVVIPVRNSKTGYSIGDVCGRIDYIKPGGSTLQDRGVYSPESLRAEYLRKTAPDVYQSEARNGYFDGIPEEAPSVITLNMIASSLCVNEFISRLYHYRHDANSSYARRTFSLAACEEEFFSESSFTRKTDFTLANGNCEPLLGIPDLTLR